jgi:peroxiredoxin
MTFFCLLAGAIALGQVGDRADAGLAPQLAPGLELVYTGTYAEESLIPNVQFVRQYRLHTHVLVLEAAARHADVAILTALSLHDPRQPTAKTAAAPASLRLEQAQIDNAGRIRNAAGQALIVAVQGPPMLELGFLAQAPPGRIRAGDSWEVAEEGRPPRTWQLVGSEVVTGITCLKLVGLQQSDDWARPRADRATWLRLDTLWLSPQLMVAQKVERVIERRDPLRQQPTQRATIRYELESRLRYPGKFFADRRQEIHKTRQFQNEVEPWLKQPALHRTQIDGACHRLEQHLENHPPTPYRPALLQLKTALDAARRGDIPVAASAEEPAPVAKSVEIGQRVPDFAVTSLTDKELARLDRLLGRPILVVFYNPETAMGKEVLRFAKSVAAAPGNRVAILAMAVTHDPDFARKQHRELALPFPILDGEGMRPMFGVEATPRLVLLDAEGVVRAATTGWGYQTPGEITDMLRRCQER